MSFDYNHGQFISGTCLVFLLLIFLHEIITAHSLIYNLYREERIRQQLETERHSTNKTEAPYKLNIKRLWRSLTALILTFASIHRYTKLESTNRCCVT